MFGDGAVTRCNPIAEKDLATYLIECGRDEGRMGRVLNLGGPDEPLTMKKQGEKNNLRHFRRRNLLTIMILETSTVDP